MAEVYIYNKEVQPIAIVDAYKSLIWAERYNTIGDCELYVPATAENLTIFQQNYYIARSYSDMVCQIKKIELDTDVENGNYLVVTGIDIKSWLDQRIVWDTVTADGNVELFMRKLVRESLGGDADDARKIKAPSGRNILALGQIAGLTEVITEQISYKNVGEKVREYCNTYSWGYKVRPDTASTGARRFAFELYKGVDRSASVVFSEEYENLATSKYIEDRTNLGNVSLTAGSGEGYEREKVADGDAAGIDRFEKFVDAKDISQTITWKELKALFPPIEDGGNGYLNAAIYMVNEIYIPVVDQSHKAFLSQYTDAGDPGEFVVINGAEFFHWYVTDPGPGFAIARLPLLDDYLHIPDDTPCKLYGNVYYGYLYARSQDKLAEYGAVTSFEGTISPNVTFVYKNDYFLGDIVTVQNEYGITAHPRIIEVIEVDDDTGYSVQPKFEYLSKE